MSLQLILGGSGSGKTTFVNKRVIELSQKNENRNKNYIIIVPEQYTMQTQKDVVQAHPNKGIMNIDVLSFGRLAYRIFSELGEPSESIIDDETKNLILKKIAKSHSDKLKLIGENINKFGYISEVKSLISEFEQYDISTDLLKEMIDNTDEKSILSYKLEDVKIIFDEFKKYKESRYITSQEQLDRLTQVVQDSAILKGSVVIFDGFTGFTPVQYRLIKALLDVSDEVMVTVTIDQENLKSQYKDNYELFATSKETIYKLRNLAKDNYIEVNEDIYLSTKVESRHSMNEELLFLEENLFRHNNKQFKGVVNNIEICVSKSVRDEAKWVANTIRKMVREENYKYKDFAIIASQTETYMGHLRRQCEAMEVPLFTDNKRSILLNSFVEYLRSLLEMREKNYSYESTFRFLKSGLGYRIQYENANGEMCNGTAGYGNLSLKAIDSLENYALKKGIKGYKKWSTPWFDLEKEGLRESEIYLENQRLNFIDQIKGFHAVLGKRNKTVEDIATALYEFLEVNNIQRKVENRAEYFAQENNFAQEKEYQQIYGAFMDLLDKLVSVLRDGDDSLKISTTEFIELLDAGFEEMRIGVIPPGIDTVIAGDLHRTRLSDVKVLFLVGANDTLLPGNMSVSGILSEGEREKISDQGFRLKPTAKELMYQHKFYMYLNLTKPSDKILISYPSLANNGKTTRGAYIINDLQSLYPDLEEKYISLDIREAEFTQVNGLEYLVQGFRDNAIMDTPEWIDLHKWYEEKDEWVEVINMMREAHLYRRVGDTLSSETAKELYGDVLQNSVSRLEKYASCPFKYFVESGLKLRERDLRECKANDIGNVIHSALELYGNELAESKKSWDEISADEQIQISNRCVDFCVEHYSDLLFRESARDEYAVDRMKRLMQRSIWALTNQLHVGDFAPEAYELKFGAEQVDNELTSVILDDGTKMNLRGTIDRVDTYEDNGKLHVKIIDYKTGKSQLDLMALKEGLQLQLFIYLDAAIKEMEKKNQSKSEILPSGVFYYKVDDPIIEGGSDEEKRLEEIQSSLKLDGLVTLESWRNMDKEVVGDSLHIPIKLKKDGTFVAKQLQIGTKELNDLRYLAMEKAKQFGEEITQGNIKVSPCIYDKINSCSYCQYKNICGFDQTIGDYTYRKINKQSNADVISGLAKDDRKEEKDGDKLD